MLTYEQIRRSLEEQPLFDQKTWQLAPRPWPLTPAQVRELEEIGAACVAFLRALEQLYLRSVEGKNLLRNRELRAPWAAAYLDRGKPADLLRYARAKARRGALPAVVRPDLLLTDKGFALTEIDAVPGGIGLTAFLNELYSREGAGEGDGDRDGGEGIGTGDAGTGRVIGAGGRMQEAFYAALAALAPDEPLPLIAIVVSDEASTYRPEMRWLAADLRARGKRVYCVDPSDVMPMGDSFCAPVDGNPERIDVLYRFWELFDNANIPLADFLLGAPDRAGPVVTPPLRPFQEEKLALALFHHHRLEAYWAEALPKKAHRVLKRIIPRSWVMEEVDLPPGAVLDGPPVGGRALTSWEQLAEATQRERNLIIKLSGFHPNAWGARSVLLGSDSSRVEWEQGVRDAVAAGREHPFIVQDYRKPARLQHPVYSTSGDGGRPELTDMHGRLRLCPYYFVTTPEKTELAGVLATFCPADKKIIHGMTDAAMLPCSEVPGEGAR